MYRIRQKLTQLSMYHLKLINYGRLYLRFLNNSQTLIARCAGLQNIYCVVLDRKYNRYDTVILVKHFLTKLASIDE